MKTDTDQTDIVNRFLRGGFKGTLGGQIVTDLEHKAICNHINYLRGTEWERVSTVSDSNEN